MDEISFQFIKNLNEASIIAVSNVELETHFKELLIAKRNRSIVEYYFTCSSSIMSFVFERFSRINILTYIDADLYFFSSPQPIYDEFNTKSIGIIEHKFSLLGRRFVKYGKYNVGWVMFRNDAYGRKCLEDWRQECLEYCFDKLENGKFADQKYLDYWPENYEGVHTINHLGANLAPWNVGNYKLKLNRITRKIEIRDQQLLFYHFSSCKKVNTNTYTTNVSKYFVLFKGVLKHNIYLPYINDIEKHSKQIGITINWQGRSGDSILSLKDKITVVYTRLLRIIFCDYVKIE